MVPIPDIAADLEVLTRQEALLRFPAFDPDTAWELGSMLRYGLLSRNAGGTVEIERDHQLLFACTTPGAKPNQADWIRRKRNTVRHFKRSSYAIGRELALSNETLESAHTLSEADFAAHGGGFPLWLKSADGPDVLAGTIVLSGMPQRDDHHVVVAAIAHLLKLTIPHLT